MNFGDVSFDYLVKMMSARFFHCKDTVFLFVLNN